MINKACQECKKPMNGGVYKAPNKCPHCSAIQKGVKPALRKRKVSEAKQAVNSGIKLPVEQTAAVNKDSAIAEKQAEVVTTKPVIAKAAAKPVAKPAAEEPKAPKATIKSASTKQSSPTGVKTTPTPKVSAQPKKATVAEEAPKHKAPAAAKPPASSELTIDENFDLDIVVPGSTVKSTTEKSVKPKPAAQDSLLKKAKVKAASPTQTPNTAKVAAELARKKLSKQANNADKIKQYGNTAADANKPRSDENVVALEKKTAKPAPQKAPANRSVSGGAGLATAKRPSSKPTPVTLTTEPSSDNVVKRMDLVSAEYVCGLNGSSKEFFAEDGTYKGGRSPELQQAFKDARKVVLAELRQEARDVGANGVVGVKLSYNTQNTSSENPVLVLVATGTAVLTRQPATV